MEGPKDIKALLQNSQILNLPTSEKPITLKNLPMDIGEIKIFIREATVDPHTIIDSQDSKLVEVVQNIREELGQKGVNLEMITNTIYNLYPPSKDATEKVRAYREGAKAKKLGDYFDNKDGSYDAVCVHKVLLAQAVASSYGIKTEFVNFGFSGQITSGESDGIGGMHAVLRSTDASIADPQKGVYEQESQYLKRFAEISIFGQGREIYTPDAKTRI